MRITRKETYMFIASVMALRGACERLKVGCTIIKDNRIVASGYNGPLNNSPACDQEHCDQSKPCTRAVHAEANAIAFAAKHGIVLEGTTIFCTHSPCIKCAELIIQSGIVKVVYNIDYRDNAGLLLLKTNGIEVIKYDGREIQELTELTNSVQ